MTWNRIKAIENVIDKRTARGASDESIITWLKSLVTTNDSDYFKKTVDMFIDAIKQTPLND